MEVEQSDPGTDSWKAGPRLARPKYGAVAVDLGGPSAGGNHPGGQVWLTGGRDGATVLQVNFTCSTLTWGLGHPARQLMIDKL